MLKNFHFCSLWSKYALFHCYFTFIVECRKIYVTNYIIFWKKFLWGGKWSILGSKMIHPHNSRSVPSISFNFAQLKGPRGMIIMLMFSLKKSLVQGRSAILAQRWHALMAHIESKIFVSNVHIVYLPQQILHNLITSLSILGIWWNYAPCRL